MSGNQQGMDQQRGSSEEQILGRDICVEVISLIRRFVKFVTTITSLYNLVTTQSCIPSTLCTFLGRQMKWRGGAFKSSNCRLSYRQMMLWQKEKLEGQNSLPYSATQQDLRPHVTRSNLSFRHDTFTCPLRSTVRQCLQHYLIWPWINKSCLISDATWRFHFWEQGSNHRSVLGKAPRKEVSRSVV